jgi:hypothetical protein
MTIEEPWRHDRKLYLELVAARLEELLEDNPDADMWTSELAAEADYRGWVFSAGKVRRHSNWVFSMDLFSENETAYERLPDVGIELRDPSELNELHEFLDLIV